MAIKWRGTTPVDIGKAAIKYGRDINRAAFVIAQMAAVSGEGRMRVGARWDVRTGHARGGLIGVAQVEGKKIVIYFIHSVEYGVFLELTRAGRFAIVWPTTLLISGEVGRSLKRMVA